MKKSLEFIIAFLAFMLSLFTLVTSVMILLLNVSFPVVYYTIYKWSLVVVLLATTAGFYQIVHDLGHDMKDGKKE